MFKRTLFILVISVLLAVTSLANMIEFDTENLFEDDVYENYYGAYTLSNNKAYNGTREGIQAGWTYDNRAGNLRINVTAGYGTVRDISITESSCLYRDLNKTDEGKIVLETSMRYLDGFDGLNMFFNDENGDTAYSLITTNGAYAVLNSDGSYTEFYVPDDMLSTPGIRVYIDFEALTAVTVINDEASITTELLSDNVMRFGFSTSDESILTIQPGLVKITANYHIEEEFNLYSGTTKTKLYKWETDSSENAYAAGGVGYVTNGSYMAREFDKKVGEKVAFEAHLFTYPGATGSFALVDGENQAVCFSFDGTNFFLNGTEVYENSEYLKNFWYRFRIEADFVNHTALIYVNGRVTGEIDLPSDLSYVSGIKLTATGDGMIFDNVAVYNLIEYDDYVPMPVKATDSDGHIVGMNICSLWSYESNHGWLTISPYEDFRPILGYYDEGSPESADWEIKMMVEHGIDFQAFCWYADKRNEPLKYPSNMLQLNEGYMYAKYSDMMNYCLIWEAANGAHPQNSEAFRNYFVPYWIEHYFKDDRYLVIDNKPVLLCFGFGSFISDVGGAANAKADLDYLRQELTKIGFDGLIFISSHSGDSATIKAAGADGVCAYNWGTAGKDVDYSIGRIESCANVGATWTVPTLSTGFNSLPWHGVRYGNMLPSDFERGLTYMRDEYFVKYPIKESWQDKLYMLSTWNEYGEGTYIMPAEKLHGFGYLEAVRNVFTDCDNDSHVDYIPTENQLSRITKNYPQHIRVLRRNDDYTPDPEKTLGPIAKIDFSNKELLKYGYCDDVTFGDGISATSSSKLAYVETADELGIELENTTNMVVEISVSAETPVSIWYSTKISPYYTKDKTLGFTAVPGTDVYTLPINIIDENVRSLRVCVETEGVTFVLKSISISNPIRLFIDGKRIDSHVYPETIDGVTYYPFDPREAQGYIMNCHFEWDYAKKELAIYGTDDRYAVFTVGSDVMLTHDGEYNLPIAVYTVDNLPMIHMESLCEALGFEYVFENFGMNIKTENYEKHHYIFTHPENEWDFTMGSELGWTADNATMYITDDNELYIKGLDGDTRTRIIDLQLKAEKYMSAEICLKFNSLRERDSIGLFFITETDKTWNESKHAYTMLPGQTSGDEYVKVTIDLKNYTNSSGDKPWKGTVTSLRFDPFNCPGSECWIKYIKLIPDPDYNAFDEKNSFTNVSFDAEDGKILFINSNNTVSIVDDPINADNKVYRIAPPEGRYENNYTGVNYQMYFEPGATYKVSYDYLGGKIGESDTETVTNGIIYVDPRYVDPAREGKVNPDDHYDGHDATITCNGDAWRHYKVEFTVNKDSFDRSVDGFRIYANPISSKSLTYYIDNLSIEKVTDTAITDVKVKRNFFISFTVSGSVGNVLPGEKSVIIAMYDKNNRLYDIEYVPLNEDSEFSYTYYDFGKVSSVKVFTWQGFRTFKPTDDVYNFNIAI